MKLRDLGLRRQDGPCDVALEGGATNGLVTARLHPSCFSVQKLVGPRVESVFFSNSNPVSGAQVLGFRDPTTPPSRTVARFSVALGSVSVFCVLGLGVQKQDFGCRARDLAKSPLRAVARIPAATSIPKLPSNPPTPPNTTPTQRAHKPDEGVEM